MECRELYSNFIDLAGDDFREDILEYKKLSDDVELPSYAVRDSAIKVRLVDGDWFRVYEVVGSGEIEWY